MKKSKIWMPILATAGVAASLTPIICLTSCGKISTIKLADGSNVDGDLKISRKWRQKKSTYRYNIEFTLTADYTSLDDNNSNAALTLKDGTVKTVSFADLDSAGVFSISAIDNSSFEIMFYYDTLNNYMSQKVNAMELKIIGSKN